MILLANCGGDHAALRRGCGSGAGVAFTDRPTVDGRRVTRQNPFSGYTRNAIVHQGRVDADVTLLNKPYTSRELADAVRTFIDRSDNGGLKRQCPWTAKLGPQGDQISILEVAAQHASRPFSIRRADATTPRLDVSKGPQHTFRRN
jgi:hypothetical protein